MRRRVDRRAFLETAGLAALSGLLAPSCASSWPRVDLAAAGSRRLARVDVSWDRVAGSAVGVRPGRHGGFRLETEQVEGKTLIHNYGHGSKGVTLSWGTAHLAVDEAMKTGHRRCAVIGCGVIGLATATLLQRRGFDVTIYARELPPETTSNAARAGSRCGASQRRPSPRLLRGDEMRGRRTGGAQRRPAVSVFVERLPMDRRNLLGSFWERK